MGVLGLKGLRVHHWERDVKNWCQLKVSFSKTKLWEMPKWWNDANIPPPEKNPNFRFLIVRKKCSSSSLIFPCLIPCGSQSSPLGGFLSQLWKKAEANGVARPLRSFSSSPSRTSHLTSASLGKPVEERVYFLLFFFFGGGGGVGVPLHPLEKAVSHYKVLLTTF